MPYNLNINKEMEENTSYEYRKEHMMYTKMKGEMYDEGNCQK